MTEASQTKCTAGPQAQGAANGFGLAPEVASFANSWLATAMQNAQAWQSEMLGFMNRRLEQDRLAWARLAECRSPQDVAQVQQDWIAGAIEAYADEGRRCAAIALEPVAGAPAAKAPPKPKAAT